MCQESLSLITFFMNKVSNFNSRHKSEVSPELVAKVALAPNNLHTAETYLGVTHSGPSVTSSETSI